MIDDDLGSSHKPCYHIQLAKNTRFTGRTAVLDELEEKLFGQEPCERAALVGLGGVGKTQIALHLAYTVKKERPEYSIFWIPIISGNSAQQAYVEMAKKLGLEKKSDDEDIRALVCRHLSSPEAGKWLLVVDNADDQELVFGSTEGGGIEEFLPRSDQGSILLTTRSRQVAVDFAQADIVDVEQMSRKEATQLLGKSLPRKQMVQDEALMIELLDYLTCLPLAITQAAAYLNRTKAPVHKYLGLLRSAEKDIPSVLGQEFRDNTRYPESRNAVATTWLVSFDQIEKSNELAVKLLSFMSYIEPKAIPQSILPGPGPESDSEELDLQAEDLESAIGELCGYSFLVRRGDSDVFDMHSLVHMATREWTKKQGRSAQVVEDAVCRLVNIFPSRNPANRELWRQYMPHALRLLYAGKGAEAEQCRYRLLSRVGHCLHADRRFKEAVQCFEEVYEWEGQRELSANGPQLPSMRQLARAYLSDRRIKEAIDIWERVVIVERGTLDENDPHRSASEHALATAYLNDRQIKKAIKILERIVAIDKTTLDEKDEFRLMSQQELARGYIDDGQTKKAIEILERVTAIRRETLDEKDHERLVSEHELGRAYTMVKQIKKGIEILEHVVATRRETLSEKDYIRLVSEHELARAYFVDGKTKKAIEILEYVVMVQKEMLEENDRNRLVAEYTLAKAYLEDGLVREAIDLLEHVLAIESQLYAEDDRDRQASVKLLARARKQLEAKQEMSGDNASECVQKLELRDVDIAAPLSSADALTDALDWLHI